MKIMIIGAGFTGTQLAKKLINEKNEVTIIDNDEDVARHVESNLDCSVYAVDGNNLQNLEDAGIAKMDALVTLTENDEINMITCSLVDSVYPDLLKIARVRNYAYYVNTNSVKKIHADAFSKDHRPLYGINYMIHPDVEAALAICKAVEHGAVSEVLSFGENDFELASVQIEKDSVFNGKELKDIRNLASFKFIIVYVERGETSFLPAGNTVLTEGDRIGVITKKDDVKPLLELCGTKIDFIKNIALVGAGRIGTLVAENLIGKEKPSLFSRLFAAKKTAQNFVIIDSDKNLSNEAQQKFPSARVFCADATDESFIQEEGLDKFNLVICATHNHEMNMIISAYLESLGVGKSIALVAHSTFSDIARKLGVDVSIPLRDTVVDSIMSHLHGKTVTGIHTVADGDFEIVECDLSKNNEFSGKMLKDISIPGEYLILLIKKTGSKNYIIPQGDTVLSSGDHLVLIERAEDKKILKKFSEE